MKFFQVPLSLVLILSFFDASCSRFAPLEEETIVIAGTNDIHGTLAPLQFSTQIENGGNFVSYESGGAAVLTAYIEVLRKQFASRFIWLDAGDQFQGSLDSNLSTGAPVVDFFNLAGLTAAAIGNHEFDFGIPVLKNRLLQASYPYLISNLQEKRTGSDAKLPNTLPSQIFSVGKLKLGVLGLLTRETPTKTITQNVEHLAFTDLRQSALLEAHKLRERGADIVLINAHVGLRCSLKPGALRSSTWSPEDPQGSCDESDEMVQLLESLPPATVDAVIAGHSHTIIHHWIAGVPVIQAAAFGRYFNLIYLTYSHKKRRVEQALSRIEGPIPVCTHIFQKQGNCSAEDPAPEAGRGSLVPVVFHGQNIRADARVEALLQKTFLKMRHLKERILGCAVRKIVPAYQDESELGNLMADALSLAGHTELALINARGLRAPLEKGPISYDALFRSYPFENHLTRVRLKGKELLLVLRYAQTDPEGFGSVAGLKLKLIHPSLPAPFLEPLQNGKREHWQRDRLLTARLASGEEIKPEAWYILSTVDFLVNGGGELGKVFLKIPKSRIEFTPILARDALLNYILLKKRLNDEKSALVNRSNPRFIFEAGDARLRKFF